MLIGCRFKGCYRCSNETSTGRYGKMLALSKQGNCEAYVTALVAGMSVRSPLLDANDVLGYDEGEGEVVDSLWEQNDDGQGATQDALEGSSSLKKKRSKRERERELAQQRRRQLIESIAKGTLQESLQSSM